MKEEYSSSRDNLTKQEVKRRKEGKKNLASEFALMQQMSEKLNSCADVTFSEKEGIIDNIFKSTGILDLAKKNYEQHLHDDIELFDLTEEKIKRADLTKIEIGKFSGSLGKGDDFYTFKSRFERVYANHPKNLLVDWLKSNHLEGEAKEAVGSLATLESIWKRLKDNFGNIELMLLHKFSKIEKLGNMSKQKSINAKKIFLQTLINVMEDVLDLAKNHDLEGEIHYGGQLQKIVSIIDSSMQEGWYKILSKEEVKKTERWSRIIEYLNFHLSIIQVKAADTGLTEFNKSLCSNVTDDRLNIPEGYSMDEVVCKLCDQKHFGHNMGLLKCKHFLVMNPKERGELVRRKRICLQCLNNETKWDDPMHSSKCSAAWACQHESHGKYDKKMHFLLCGFHTFDKRNKDLYQRFKVEILNADWQKKLHPQVYFTHQQNSINSMNMNREHGREQLDDMENNLADAKSHGPSAFMIQAYPFNGHVFNLMFDSGCQTFVCRKDAVDKLPKSCVENTMKGPIIIRGVGCNEVSSQYGQYSISLPIFDGRNATFNGICLESITSTMPLYPVGKARKVIEEDFIKQGGNVKDLPQVPPTVGGDIDFMFGIQYNFYMPRLIHIMPSGLCIYKSIFEGVDGTRGCIGGPHELFRDCESQFSGSSQLEFHAFLDQQLQLFNSGFKICVDHDAITLPVKQEVLIMDEATGKHQFTLVSSVLNEFEESDSAGTRIEYRCVKCRGCADCKSSEKVDKISLQEEYEQDLINNSVHVDFDNEETVASLPFNCDPTLRLKPNKEIALKIYKQQLRRINRNWADRGDVINFEKKLQDAGHVEWIENLDAESKLLLNRSPIAYFMPWRYVHNANSTTTPVRIVFDASSTTDSGYSLNDILAKGANSMNLLLHIFIRFRSAHIGLHTDITKMYNVVKLKPEDWTFQRYLWEETLDESKDPTEKIIKTLIYGVKSSGNQAERGLRETARKHIDNYPLAAKAIIEDTYVDDCATGAPCLEKGRILAEDINKILAKGGFTTKGFTMSKILPLPALTKDGKSGNIAGIKWFPEEDVFQLCIDTLNFGRKYRGRKQDMKGNFRVSEKLTKRICVGKVAEIFDICGIITPIVAGLKLDLRDLILQKFDWDEKIPDTYCNTWIKNFDLISKAGDIIVKRAVIPEDAISLNMELISAGDAGEKIACAGCYVRFKRKNGNYSCQLILGKSKILSESISLPRAELFAATLNTHVCEIVTRSLKEKIDKSILVLDSEIALHWLSNETKQLKPWVRNKVIEILRFTKKEQWFHVESSNNPADVGTRKGASVSDVKSTWLNGKPWMQTEIDFEEGGVLAQIDKVKLRNEQMSQAAIEKCKQNDVLTLTHKFSLDVEKRLSYSNYLIDPNHFRFHKVVRIMALVLRVCNNLLKRSKLKLLKYADENKEMVNVTKKFSADHNDLCIIIEDDEIQASLNYFFTKATSEVKFFVKPKLYQRNTFEKNGIIYYASRVLPENIEFKCKMTDVMYDLSKDSFVVPVVDRYSPLAYSIVNDVHWYHSTVKHCGIETTIRHILTIAHIFQIRELVKAFRENCKRCRYLLKRTIEVEMSPASRNQLCIAPAFYVTQIDLCGPFSAYSKHNKRTTIKVWIVAFVCCTTGMTNLKIMEGYGTTEFLLAFTRFSCEVGCPKFVLPDEGSQLVSGCEKIVLNMTDIKGMLNREFGVQFEPSPVGGHNFHGKVERKIRTVRESVEKSVHNARLSTVEWETLCAEIANSINNLPIAVGSEVDGLENLDLITPNRLKLGRNNDRSPIGCLEISDKVDLILKSNSKIFETWWENWLVSALPKLIPRPKWFKNDENIEVGDIVLFKKSEGLLSGIYKFGMVEDTKIGSDERIRSVVIKYRNENEGVNRLTSRAVRSLIIIHKISELDIMKELGNASIAASVNLAINF